MMIIIYGLVVLYSLLLLFYLPGGELFKCLPAQRHAPRSGSSELRCGKRRQKLSLAGPNDVEDGVYPPILGDDEAVAAMVIW